MQRIVCVAVASASGLAWPTCRARRAVRSAAETTDLTVARATNGADMKRTFLWIRGLRPRAVLLAVLAVTLGACVFIPQASATYPGHNGLIAFSAQPDGHGYFQVYTIRPNGHDVRQVTHLPDSGVEDWSP